MDSILVVTDSSSVLTVHCAAQCWWHGSFLQNHSLACAR